MTAAAAAAAVLQKERRAIALFRQAGAVAPDRAVSLAEIGATEGIAFHRLIARAVLRETTPGRYYLDEPTWTAMRRLRHRMLAVVLVVLLGLLLIGVVAVHP